MTLSLWAWCALLSFPLFTVQELESTTFQILAYQTTGLLLFIGVTLAVAPARAATAIFKCGPFQTTIVVIIFLSLALQFHGPEVLILEGIAYTIALLAAIVCFSTIWTLPLNRLAICFGGCAVILAIFGISAVAVFGWPQGRVVGHMHPNLFGSLMLTAFVLSQFSEGFIMNCVRVTGFVLSAAVSSRFAVIACFLAFVIFEVSWRPLSLRLALYTLAAVATLLMFPHLLTDLLALNDPGRNLDSGFTGRDEQWGRAIAAITEDPFGLGFKRPAVENAGHNGYLRWLLEFGVFGGSLISAATAAIVVVAVIDIFLVRTTDQRTRQFVSARAAGLVALAFATFFQPQLFNLGDILGLAIMLMFFSPRIAPDNRYNR
jgi:hypothetical protein